MSTISWSRSIENKRCVYRGKNFMKKFSELLRKHVMKIIDCIKDKMKLLAAEIILKCKTLLYV